MTTRSAPHCRASSTMAGTGESMTTRVSYATLFGKYSSARRMSCFFASSAASSLVSAYSTAALAEKSTGGTKSSAYINRTRAPTRSARRLAKRSACPAGSLKSVGTRISFGRIESMKHLQRSGSM